MNHSYTGILPEQPSASHHANHNNYTNYPNYPLSKINTPTEALKSDSNSYHQMYSSSSATSPSRTISALIPTSNSEYKYDHKMITPESSSESLLQVQGSGLGSEPSMHSSLNPETYQIKSGINDLYSYVHPQDPHFIYPGDKISFSYEAENAHHHIPTSLPQHSYHNDYNRITSAQSPDSFYFRGNIFVEIQEILFWNLL